MITSNKMPELAPTDIVKLRNGKIGIVLGNKNSNNHLAIYTNNTTCVSCEEPTTMTVKEIEKIIGHPFTVIEEEVGEDE